MPIAAKSRNLVMDLIVRALSDGAWANIDELARKLERSRSTIERTITKHGDHLEAEIRKTGKVGKPSTWYRLRLPHRPLQLAVLDEGEFGQGESLLDDLRLASEIILEPTVVPVTSINAAQDQISALSENADVTVLVSGSAKRSSLFTTPTIRPLIDRMRAGSHLVLNFDPNKESLREHQISEISKAIYEFAAGQEHNTNNYEEERWIPSSDVLDSDETKLLLGWALDDELKSGSLSAGDDLLEVSPAALQSNCLVIAQSGAGKTTFLARIVEELAAKTRARMVIFDPNSDFVRLGEVEEKRQRRGFEDDSRPFPKTSEDDDFAKNWRTRVSDAIRVFTNSRRPKTATSSMRPIQVWWPSVPTEMVASDVPRQRVYRVAACHSIVRQIGDLVAAADRVEGDSRFISSVQSILSFAMSPVLPDEKLDLVTGELARQFPFVNTDEFIHRAGINIVAQSEALDSVAVGLYLQKLQIATESGMVANAPENQDNREDVKIEIVDLGSLRGSSAQKLAGSAYLNSVWQRADQERISALTGESDDLRTPIFVVVDEAHHWVPRNSNDPETLVIREQFRRIAAEGRKYGISLLLATQRPDKLDDITLAEFENIAIMKLGSRRLSESLSQNVTSRSRREYLERCTQFGIGDALLLGHWRPSNGPFVHIAPRRTPESGFRLPTGWLLSNPKPYDGNL